MPLVGTDRYFRTTSAQLSIGKEPQIQAARDLARQERQAARDAAKNKANASLFQSVVQFFGFGKKVESSPANSLITMSSSKGNRTKGDRYSVGPGQFDGQYHPGNISGTAGSSSSAAQRSGNRRHSAFPVATPAAFPPRPIPHGKLDSMYFSLKNLMKELGHHEMWGIPLVDDNIKHLPTRLVLAKYLQASNNDTEEAIKRLRSTMIWRKQTKPRELMTKVYSHETFAGLGFVHNHEDDEGRVVAAYTLFGEVCRGLINSSEGLEEWTNWRIALQEMSIARLNLSSIEKLETWADADVFKLVHIIDLTGFLRAYWSAGVRIDFALHIWKLLPRDTSLRWTFMDPRHHLAYVLPSIAGDWPREFCLDEAAPLLREGAAWPKLDSPPGFVVEVPDERPVGNMQTITSDQPDWYRDAKGRLHRLSNDTTHSLLGVEGVCDEVPNAAGRTG
ncbi:hypothetical protein GE09DRAFT_1190868 [Coniochaeta sp. 2T2.1]|nr:hypothetical protein GE09DRAFT_1190868 [Coniochaeta sp. 2T2.1]